MGHLPNCHSEVSKGAWVNIGDQFCFWCFYYLGFRSAFQHGVRNASGTKCCSLPQAFYFAFALKDYPLYRQSDQAHYLVCIFGGGTGAWVLGENLRSIQVPPRLFDGIWKAQSGYSVEEFTIPILQYFHLTCRGSMLQAETSTKIQGTTDITIRNPRSLTAHLIWGSIFRLTFFAAFQELLCFFAPSKVPNSRPCSHSWRSKFRTRVGLTAVESHLALFLFETW